MIYVE